MAVRGILHLKSDALSRPFMKRFFLYGTALTFGGGGVIIQSSALVTSRTQAPLRQEYPLRPVRLITPFAPGGGTDVVARVLAKELSNQWTQPVVVDNRPGANSILATTLAAHSNGDGYTLLLVSASFSSNASLHRNLPYDPLKDLKSVTQTAFQPYVLVVHPSLPVSNVQQFIQYAKTQGDKLNYGAPGTQNQLAMEWFKFLTHTHMVHVAYKGAGLALTDLISGQIQLLFSTTLTIAPHRNSGRLRALAVTSIKRAAAMSDLPTLDESGIRGFNVSAWNGIMVPFSVEPTLIQKLNHDIVKALRSPSAEEQLARNGAQTVGSSAQDFLNLISLEIKNWTQVAKIAGIVQE